MKKILFYFGALFFVFTSCTSTGRRMINSDVLSLPEPGEIDQPQALVRWQSDLDDQAPHVDLKSLHAKPLECAQGGLLPTHPQQTTKIYHRLMKGTYDLSKIVVEQKILSKNHRDYKDQLCLISTQPTNSQNSRSCVQADWPIDAIISDTFVDHCGHTYRGFWHMTFMKRHESPASLFSLGRTLYKNPHTTFWGDVTLGYTYEVDESRFLFLTDLFPGDEEKIKISKTQAIESKEVIYDPKTLQYFENPH